MRRIRSAPTMTHQCSLLSQETRIGPRKRRTVYRRTVYRSIHSTPGSSFDEAENPTLSNPGIVQSKEFAGNPTSYDESSFRSWASVANAGQVVLCAQGSRR